MNAPIQRCLPGQIVKVKSSRTSQVFRKKNIFINFNGAASNFSLSIVLLYLVSISRHLVVLFIDFDWLSFFSAGHPPIIGSSELRMMS